MKTQVIGEYEWRLKYVRNIPNLVSRRERRVRSPALTCLEEELWRLHLYLFVKYVHLFNAGLDVVHAYRCAQTKVS